VRKPRVGRSPLDLRDSRLGIVLGNQDGGAQARLDVGEMGCLPVVERRTESCLQLNISRGVAFQQGLEHAELNVVGVEMLGADKVDI
jgi:hypothetical protein